MDGHFSEKINMNGCIQTVFFLANLDIFRLPFALITAEKQLACYSGLPWGQSKAL